MGDEPRKERGVTIKYTLTFTFKTRVDYRERTYKDTRVSVFADNAKEAVSKAQKLLWDGIYDVETTAISAEEVYE